MINLKLVCQRHLQNIIENTMLYVLTELQFWRNGSEQLRDRLVQSEVCRHVSHLGGMGWITEFLPKHEDLMVGQQTMRENYKVNRPPPPRTLLSVPAHIKDRGLSQQQGPPSPQHVDHRAGDPDRVRTKFGQISALDCEDDLWLRLQ